MNEHTPRIDPAKVAAKQAALHNLRAPKFADAVAAQPRLIELLWFIQWVSMQPGGVDKFAVELIAQSGERIGTEAMRRIGKTTEPYTAEERNAVIADFPGNDCNFGLSRAECASMAIRTEFMSKIIGRCHAAIETARPNLAFVSQQNHAEFLAYCRRFALAELPWTLTDLCIDQYACLSETFWFQDLEGALIEAMDAHAARVNLRLADTQIARQVTDALEFAWSEKGMVEVIGDSRFGKTEAVKNFCAAFPGRARLVKTPCTNDMHSFFEAIADAVGVEVSLHMKAAEIRRSLEFIFRHSGLMFVFDESHWLIPQNFSARTMPFRLNYVRSQILDNGCPVLLVATPQLLATASKTYENVSGFNFVQWRGRILRTACLISEPPQADLLAIVKLQFPGLKEAYAQRIIAAAYLSDKFIFAVESIAKNARAEARKNGHAEIELSDLEAGITLAGINLPPIVAPQSPSPRASATRRRIMRSAADTVPMDLETPRRPAATSADLLPAPARSVQPLATVNTED